jgi:hypothetical protein
MDINYIEGLEGIENAILNPRSYDWWMLGVAFANLIAFVILTFYIYKLNKKVAKHQKEIQIEIAKNQENLQKRNLKLQLFEKRYPLYQSIVDVREKFDLDVFDICYHTEKFEKNDFQNELSQALNILKYHINSSIFLLDIDLGNDIGNFIQTQQIFLNEFIKLASLYKTEKYNIKDILDKYDGTDFITWIFDNQESTPFFRDLLKLYYDDENIETIYDKIILEFQEYLSVYDLEK